jgi:CHAD domain-containing protein
MAHATTPIPGGLPGLLRHHTHALVEAIPRARDGHARAVHRARVASRRLREALPVAGGVRPTAPALVARRQLRRVTAALGDVREMDVALQTFDQEAQAHRWPPAIVRRLRHHLEGERQRRDVQMHAGLDRIDLDRLSAEITALAHGLEARAATAWRRRLTTRLRQRARAVVRALAALGTLYVPEPLHMARIAIKKLRYTLELAKGATGAPVASDISTLRNAQDLLGGLHDLQILQAHVQALAARAVADRRARRELERIVATFETECRARHAEFLRHRDALAALATRINREAALWIDTPRPRMVRMRPAARRRTLTA